MAIPQFKVYMSDDVDDYVLPVLHSGFIGQGQKVEEFESQLKTFLDLSSDRNLLTVNSATSGLMLALKLAGAKPGASVVSTPMTCSATNEAIALMGAEIIWADINEFGNIDSESVLKKVRPDTVAVMAVDWGGLPCNYADLREALNYFDNNVYIIEDAAHAFGAEFRNTSVANSGGDFVVFSFQAIKLLTTGDGGAVVTPAGDMYERAKLLRWYGLDRTKGDAMRSRQDIKEVGFKFHMNDIAASIGLANLPHIEKLLAKHRSNAELYDIILPESCVIDLPHPYNGKSSDWFYTIKIKNPLDFEDWMKAKNIGVSQIHYRNDKYSVFSYAATYLPALNDLFETMCAIPCGWWLTEDDIFWIADCVREYNRK